MAFAAAGPGLERPDVSAVKRRRDCAGSTIAIPYRRLALSREGRLAGSFKAVMTRLTGYGRMMREAS